MKKDLAIWVGLIAVTVLVGLWSQPEYEAEAQGIGAPNAILCNQTTQGTGTQVVIAAATGKNIVICGWDVNANVAAGAFSLIAGTGATCGTPTRNFAVWTGLPAGVFVHHPTYAFAQSPTGSDLCVTVATTVSWLISWGQF